jgi:hypothetical protein
MTPKEKAIELVDMFMEHTVEWDKIKEVAFDSEYHAKKCALIAVDFAKEFITGDLSEAFDKFLYIQEIKEEIEKL